MEDKKCYKWLGKRFFDLLLSAPAILIFSPFLLGIALIIKLESRGPVFYRGVRAGKDLKPFRIYKFRTMVANAEQLGGPSTRTGDPRLTKFGKFLRRYKLDELPQLINIIRGDMSFVGPRPEVLNYAKLYKGNEEIICKLKPGLTDFASLWNSHEEERLARAANTEEAEKMYLQHIRPEKVKLQMKYVKEMSFWTDLSIIIRTLRSLFL